MILKPALLMSLMCTGAIFGFFYAWVCSTMWGLDTMDPRDAIAAMSAMNQSVRNPVFFASFMGTPVVLIATCAVAFASDIRSVAILIGLALVVYILGAFLPTRLVNVEMNLTLEATPIPQNLEAAQAIWAAYSPKWQLFNQIRTAASGLSLALVGTALLVTR